MPQVNSTARYFYQGAKLNNVTCNERGRCLLNVPFISLAEQEQNECRLIAMNVSGSVLRASVTSKVENHSYAPYGHDLQSPSSLTLLTFNAQRFDAGLTCYLLGNGYRAYSPITMRFHSPDNLSPFGKGGFNAYAYCAGDPINNTDPSGHAISNSVSYLVNITLEDILFRKKSSSPLEVTPEVKTNLTKLRNLATIDRGKTISERLLKSIEHRKLENDMKKIERTINSNNTWLTHNPVPSGSSSSSYKKATIRHRSETADRITADRYRLASIQEKIKTVERSIKDLDADETQLNQYLDETNKLLRNS